MEKRIEVRVWLSLSTRSISRACTRGRGNDKKRHAFFRVDAIEFATNSAKFLRRSVFDIRSIRIYSSFIFPPSWREEDTLPFRKNLSRGENFNKSLLLPFWRAINLGWPSIKSKSIKTSSSGSAKQTEVEDLSRVWCQSRACKHVLDVN